MFVTKRRFQKELEWARLRHDGINESRYRKLERRYNALLDHLNLEEQARPSHIVLIPKRPT